MKYVLIDTNIFLDMLIDRKNQVSSKLVESFEKLLDFDEIKLVVPSIVRFETYKHIEEEFSKVSTNLKKAIKNIDELYGVNAYKVNGLDIKEYKKKSKKELQDAADMFDKNKDTYLIELKRLIEKVFAHRNTIIINEDDKVVKACFVRRMYKKAPFHIEGKDSIADGMITEILININDYIHMVADSEVYFVTGNYTDFSETKNKKDTLHPHIFQDLVSRGLDKKVFYIRTFQRLIGELLSKEVDNADLKEEFLHELKEMDYIDIRRESYGLSSLSSFESNFEDDFTNSDFYKIIVEKFERINSTYSDFEDFISFYEFELLDYFTTIESSSIDTAVSNMNEFFISIGKPTVASSLKGIEDIRNWINTKIEDININKYDIRLPHEIEFGDNIELLNVDKQKFYFIIDELQLSPDDGGQDEIDIRIMDESNNVVARGDIQIIYGYIEEDDDGGIGDGCSEGVDYSTLEIEEEIERIASELESERDKNEDMIDDLRSRFNL